MDVRVLLISANTERINMPAPPLGLGLGQELSGPVPLERLPRVMLHRGDRILGLSTRLGVASRGSIPPRRCLARRRLSSASF